MRVERFAIVGILAIVLVAVFAVSWSFSTTGYLAQNGYGSVAKVYGGNIGKHQRQVAASQNTEAFYMMRLQEYMYRNKDRWVCTFGDEALASEYPCIFDQDLQKYCCVMDDVLRV